MLTNKNRTELKRLVEEFGLASQEFGAQEENQELNGSGNKEEFLIAQERMYKIYKDLMNLLAES